MITITIIYIIIDIATSEYKNGTAALVAVPAP